MLKNTEVLNKSKNIVEDGVEVNCPRCKGFGAIIKDAALGGNCSLCKGEGNVIMSKSGWTVPLYDDLSSSRLW